MREIFIVPGQDILMDIEIAKRNIVDVMTEEEYLDLIKKGDFKFYWGIAPTGPFHIGYIVPLGKFLDLIKLGGKGTIMIADWHAYLDDRKTPWEEMEIRSKFYEICIKKILERFLDIEKMKFVRGSEFQRKPEYMEDLIRASGFVTVKRAIRSASEVVRIKENPHVSELIYPIMQVLDVKHLNVDLALGGIDQRHIYALAREILPEIGYKPGVYVFTPLITSLTGPDEKMSASKPNTHISVLDSEEIIKNKIRKAYCPKGEVDKNPIIDIVKYIVFPFYEKIKIVNERTKEEKEYNRLEEFLKDYREGKIHPLYLKNAVSELIIDFFKPVREYFEKNQEFLEEVRKSMKKSGYII